MGDGRSFCGKVALRRKDHLLTPGERSHVPAGMLRSRRRLTQLPASTRCRKTRAALLPLQSAQLFSLRPQRDLQTHLVRLRLDKRAPLGSVHLLQQPVAGSLKIGRARLQSFLAVGIAEARVAVACLPVVLGFRFGHKPTADGQPHIGPRELSVEARCRHVPELVCACQACVCEGLSQ